MTLEISEDTRLNFTEQKANAFAATGPDFWDKERELKYCWSNSSRDWSIYSTDQTTYSWDYRETEHREK